jgi:hypothetical protein
MLRFTLCPVGLLALALVAGPAPAQQLSYPPPTGNMKMWPWNVGYTGVVRPAAPTPPTLARRPPTYLPPRWDGTLLVTVTQPAAARAAAPLAVNLRGPDGLVRSFPVEGGPEAIQRREVIVHPGESATVNVTGTVRAK